MSYRIYLRTFVWYLSTYLIAAWLRQLRVLTPSEFLNKESYEFLWTWIFFWILFRSVFRRESVDPFFSRQGEWFLDFSTEESPTDSIIGDKWHWDMILYWPPCSCKLGRHSPKFLHDSPWLILSFWLPTACLLTPKEDFAQGIIWIPITFHSSDVVPYLPTYIHVVNTYLQYVISGLEY